MNAWTSILDCTERGARPTLSNAVRVLQHDETLGAETIWYDEFLDRIFFANSPVREWSDEDDFRLTVYMQERCLMTTVPDHLVAKAVRLVARQRSRHIVRDWLGTLVWDRVPRMALAFEDHWGVVCGSDMPTDYVRAASANFFLALVARVSRPGCQVDTMPVFEGEQGLRKSSALRVIGGAYYAAASDSVQRKDFFESLRGKWLIEIGELDAFTRAEVTRVKTVISTPIDRYRPSYGRNALDFPRQCVFAGTTNKDDWGNDDTGLRRFWPIKCGGINLATLAAAREQLFAEAVAAYRADATWWTMPHAALAVQADRQADHAWDETIRANLVALTDLTTRNILVQILKFQEKDITRVHELTVGSIMRRLGFSKKNLMVQGVQGKRWVENATMSRERESF